MSSIDDLIRRHEENRRAYEREDRRVFFEQYDGSRRIHDLEFPPPTCPVCDGDLEVDGSWWCAGCCLGWDNNGTHGFFDASAAIDSPDHPRSGVEEGYVDG